MQIATSSHPVSQKTRAQESECPDAPQIMRKVEHLRTAEWFLTKPVFCDDTGKWVQGPPDPKQLVETLPAPSPGHPIH
jgi:hypothetical protein